MYLRYLNIKSVDLFLFAKCNFRMQVHFKGSLCFQRFLFFCLLNLHLVCSFIGIFKIFNGLEEGPNNCCLLISIQVSRLGFNFSIRIPIPFWILFRIILLFVFIRSFRYFLKSRSRFEHLVLSKTILEGLVLYL